MIKKYSLILITLLSLIICPTRATESTLMDTEIKYVVILMMENRSFDNVLAWLYENDSPMQFIPQELATPFLGLSNNSLPCYSNCLKNSAGNIVFCTSPIKGIPSVEGQPGLNSPQFNPHEHLPHVITQIYNRQDSSAMENPNNMGKPNMRGFLQDYASLWQEHEWEDARKEISAVMETYTENELPVLYGLAKHYAVSDLWFSSVPTQTNPNRAFSICGTADGQVINGDLGHSTFMSDTIWNRLSELSPNTTWMVFWQSDMLQNVLSGPYHGKETFNSLTRIKNLDKHFARIDVFHELARNGQLPSISLLEPQWTIANNFNLIDDRISTHDQFLVGLQGNDLHPPGDVRPGEDLIANIYTSLIANTEAWGQTLLIITFDEHGGLFDHVPPPPAIAPDTQFQEGFEFGLFGVRVPAIFVSPRIQKKTVIRSDQPSIPFDHTSLIATLLKWKQIDKHLWRMGLRTDRAPTFDPVITLSKPRSDAIIIPTKIQSPLLYDFQQIVHMEQSFHLKNKSGSYLLQTKPGHIPCLGKCLNKQANSKATLQFINGSGIITHGSFVLVKYCEGPDCSVLETHPYTHDCSFKENSHSSAQWWTVKSVDHPYLGYPIQYGDRIYLENHVYTDLINYLPGRLVGKKGWLTPYISTTIISESDPHDYWIVEKP